MILVCMSDKSCKIFAIGEPPSWPGRVQRAKARMPGHPHAIDQLFNVSEVWKLDCLVAESGLGIRRRL